METLKNWKTESGHTVQHMADMLGVTKWYLSKAINGHKKLADSKIAKVGKIRSLEKQIKTNPIEAHILKYELKLLTGVDNKKLSPNNVVRVRRSEHMKPDGPCRRFNYSLKKPNEKRFYDLTITELKMLGKFELQFAHSVWLEGEKEEIKKRWENKTICLN